MPACLTYTQCRKSYRCGVHGSQESSEYHWVDIHRSGCTFSLLSEKRDADLDESWVPGFSIYVPSGQTEIEIELVGAATRLGRETVKRSRANLSVSFSSPKEGPDA